MVGSLAGIVIAAKLSIVKRAYKVEDQPIATRTSGYVEVPSAKDNDIVAADDMAKIDGDVAKIDGDVAPVKDENSAFNKKTVYKILFFWALTVPVALGVSYAVTALLLINAN